MNTNYIKRDTVYHTSYAMLPTVFFTEPRYKSLSNDAKIAYALLLNRVALSVKSNYIKDGKVYLFFTREEMAEKIGCGLKKAIALFAELRKADLIEEVRQGYKKANMIFVKMPETAVENTEKTEEKKQKRATALQRKKDFLKKLNTTIKVKRQVLSSMVATLQSTKEQIGHNKKALEVAVTDTTVQNVKNQIDYAFFKDNGIGVGMVDTMVLALSEMYTAPHTTIAGQTVARSVVVETLQDLDSTVIVELLDSFTRNSLEGVRNLKAYLKSVLFNYTIERQAFLSTPLFSGTPQQEYCTL